ncbi:hypothetical protein TUA1478L_24130 [Lactiplantibacillus plantarum]
MSINSTLATWTGKSAYWFLHTFRGGGSSLPGKLALKLDPTILKHLAKTTTSSSSLGPTVKR